MTGGGAVGIEGLRDTVRKLERLGAEVGDLKGIFTSAAELTAADLRPRLHTRSGALVGSVRVAKAKNRAAIRVGSSRAPYAAFHNYGARSFPGVHALEDARAATSGRVADQVDRGLSALLSSLDLKD